MGNSQLTPNPRQGSLSGHNADNLHFIITNNDIITLGHRGAWEAAMDRIISAEMDIPGYIRPGINGHQFQALAAGGDDSGSAAANAPTPVEGYPDRIPPPIDKRRPQGPKA